VLIIADAVLLGVLLWESWRAILGGGCVQGSAQHSSVLIYIFYMLYIIYIILCFIYIYKTQKHIFSS